jgi:hypothetical protein
LQRALNGYNDFNGCSFSAEDEGVLLFLPARVDFDSQLEETGGQ